MAAEGASGVDPRGGPFHSRGCDLCYEYGIPVKYMVDAWCSLRYRCEEHRPKCCMDGCDMPADAFVEFREAEASEPHSYAFSCGNHVEDVRRDGETMTVGGYLTDVVAAPKVCAGGSEMCSSGITMVVMGEPPRFYCVTHHPLCQRAGCAFMARWSFGTSVLCGLCKDFFEDGGALEAQNGSTLSLEDSVFHRIVYLRT